MPSGWMVPLVLDTCWGRLLNESTPCYSSIPKTSRNLKPNEEQIRLSQLVASRRCTGSGGVSSLSGGGSGGGGASAVMRGALHHAIQALSQ